MSRPVRARSGVGTRPSCPPRCRGDGSTSTSGTGAKLGVRDQKGIFSGLPSSWGRDTVAWIVRLVSTGADGEEHSTDVLRFARPEDLTDLGSLGLTLAEGKKLLAGLQQEIVAAQARVHAMRRPECRGCGEACQVKDYRQHRIATLFGQVAVRLPRFRCADCGVTEAGVDWPPHTHRPRSWTGCGPSSPP